MMNKKGAISGKLVLIIFVLLIVGILVIQNIKIEETTPAGKIKYTRFGDLLSEETGLNLQLLNVVSYVTGGVPDALITEVGEISASIVIFALFIMFVFTFWDVFYNFGFFSTMVAGVISFTLAIVLANLKMIMWIAVWCFGIVAGIGAVSVIVGILVPFVIFAAINIFLVQALGEWAINKKIVERGKAVKEGAGAVGVAVEGLRDVANAFSKKKKKQQ